MASQQSGGDHLAPPTFLFPSSTSQQRISSTRNKVSLKPGRSLMDWIRLTHTGKDLTGVGSHRLEITQEELAKHSQQDDAWICLKGLVYNITPYMEYHPGGYEELMKGAGKDATDLFNEVHKWVNFESMLEKCLIGRLVTRPFNAAKKNPSQDSLFKVPVTSNSPTAPNTPKYDWFQTDKSINLVLYTKSKEVTQDDVTIDLIERRFRLAVRLADNLYILLLELEGQVNFPPSVKIGKGSGCVEVILLKQTTSVMWSQLGSSLPGHESLQDHKQSDSYFRSCKIVKKEQVTNDTFLFSLEPPSGTLLRVAPGRHVSLSVKVQGMSVVRSYTPVEKFSGSNTNGTLPTLLYLMIKIYSDGALTSTLHNLNLGDNVLVSDPMGDFDVNRLKNCSSLCLLAAGTGFTPMVAVINRFLVWNQKGKVWLMMFNKTFQDIPWREELENLVIKEQRISVRHVLSEPNSEWEGQRGRIRSHLLEAFLPKLDHSSVTDISEDIEEDDPGRGLLCVCGPTQFTKTAESLLLKMGYSSEYIHCFTG